MLKMAGNCSSTWFSLEHRGWGNWTVVLTYSVLRFAFPREAVAKGLHDDFHAVKKSTDEKLFTVYYIMQCVDFGYWKTSISRSTRRSQTSARATDPVKFVKLSFSRSVKIPGSGSWSGSPPKCGDPLLGTHHPCKKFIKTCRQFFSYPVLCSYVLCVDVICWESCQFLPVSFSGFYYYLVVHISSYCIVYDMYVLPFGVRKNNNNNLPITLTEIINI